MFITLSLLFILSSTLLNAAEQKTEKMLDAHTLSTFQNDEYFIAPAAISISYKGQNQHGHSVKWQVKGKPYLTKGDFKQLLGKLRKIGNQCAGTLIINTFFGTAVVNVQELNVQKDIIDYYMRYILDQAIMHSKNEHHRFATKLDSTLAKKATLNNKNKLEYDVYEKEANANAELALLHLAIATKYTKNLETQNALMPQRE